MGERPGTLRGCVKSAGSSWRRPGARALAWVGGELYDAAAGWTHYPLDGSHPRRRHAGYGPGFDTAR
jgi:hypothetical protein